ncbi:hypothetical protein F383_19407 [Gossypium arboreum]|nr:hypothetical protein F383_19407 [Gossypium arboreum]
MRPCGAY